MEKKKNPLLIKYLQIFDNCKFFTIGLSKKWRTRSCLPKKISRVSKHLNQLKIATILS